MSLHPPVLFIGDRPNPRKNRSMDVPFVGTKSYLVLLEWFYRMDVDVNQVSIVNSHDVNGQITFAAPISIFDLSKTRFILLGKAAEEAWDTWWIGSLNPPKAFKLPHPSGLNRELNDVKKLSTLLTRCREFIYS